MMKTNSIVFFVLLFKLIFNTSIAQNFKHLFIVDTNNMVIIDNKPLYKLGNKLDVDYNTKKIDNKIYLTTVNLIDNERAFYVYDLKFGTIHLYCKHIISSTSIFNYSIYEIRGKDTCLFSFRDGGNSIQFANKSLESLITYFSIVEHFMRITDFSEGHLSYTPAFRTLQIVKNGKKVLLKENMFSVKHGYNFVYSNIVNDDFVIYIEGVENPLLAINQSIPQERKIKIFDIKRMVDLDFKLRIFDAWRVYFNKNTFELLILTKGYHDDFYTATCYSIFEKKYYTIGDCRHACWL